MDSGKDKSSMLVKQKSEEQEETKKEETNPELRTQLRVSFPDRTTFWQTFAPWRDRVPCKWQYAIMH
jgi:hypothetical protein